MRYYVNMDKRMLISALLFLTFIITFNSYAQEMGQFMMMRHDQEVKDEFAARMFSQDYSSAVIEDESSGAASKAILYSARLTGEFLAGSLGTLASDIVILSAYNAYAKYMAYGITTCYEDSIVLLGIIPVANSLTSASLVYLVGNIGSDTGSFLPTLIGSSVGFVAGAILFISPDWLSWNGLRLNSLCRLLSIPVASTIGAIIGFNLTKDNDKSTDSNSQIKGSAPQFKIELLKMRF